MPYLDSLPADATLGDVFAAYPDTSQPLRAYHDALLRGPSPFTEGERELIAAYVSGLNACAYCRGVHTATAETYGIAEGVLTQLLDDLERAPVDLLRRIEATLQSGRVQAAHAAGGGRDPDTATDVGGQGGDSTVRLHTFDWLIPTRCHAALGVPPREASTFGSEPKISVDAGCKAADRAGVGPLDLGERESVVSSQPTSLSEPDKAIAVLREVANRRDQGVGFVEGLPELMTEVRELGCRRAGGQDRGPYCHGPAQQRLEASHQQQAPRVAELSVQHRRATGEPEQAWGRVMERGPWDSVPCTCRSGGLQRGDSFYTARGGRTKYCHSRSHLLSPCGCSVGLRMATCCQARFGLARNRSPRSTGLTHSASQSPETNNLQYKGENTCSDSSQLSPSS